jgi:ribosomal protein L37AE/L43A
MKIRKPKIPKCPYCGQELICIDLYENIWTCEYHEFYFRSYGGEPFPKFGYYSEEFKNKLVNEIKRKVSTMNEKLIIDRIKELEKELERKRNCPTCQEIIKLKIEAYKEELEKLKSKKQVESKF